jgi:hypothetical protein
LKTLLSLALLVLALNGCAASQAELKAAQAKRERIANDYDLTADGWQSLGVNQEQQERYRKLADQARKNAAEGEVASDSLLIRLIKAVFADPALPTRGGSAN